MKAFCVLLLLFVTLNMGCCQGAVPKVIRQSYQVKSATTDGLNRLSAVVFEVQFDQALAVSGVPLPELSQDVLTPVMLNFFNVYSPLPMSSAGLLGLSSLECDGEMFVSVPYDDGTLDEQELLPAPSTGDPHLGFFDTLHVVGSANFRLEEPVLNDTYSVLLMLEDSRECDPFVGCLFATGLAPRLVDTDFSTCKLHFSNGYDFSQPSTPTVLHGIGSLTDSVEGIVVTDFVEKELPVCNYFTLDIALNNFQQATDHISGTDFEGLSASFWRAVAFALADSIVSCQNLLETFLIPTIFYGEEETSRCLLGETDELFLSDPCCNIELRWESECCAPRSQPYSFPSANMTNSTGFIMGEAGCHHRYILKSAISNYLNGLDDNINPATGCAASAAKIASPELFASYFGFVATCKQILFGSTFCLSNDDCYTYCFGQACSGAWNSSIGGLNHTQCFADQMHPTVASIVEYALGVPGATRDEFVAAMADQLWDYNCNGYELQSYIFPRDYSQPFGFDYRFIPADICLGLSEVCHNDYDLDPSDCSALTGPNVDYVCAQCYGSTCYSEYLPRRCTYTGGYNVATCDALGGVFDPNFSFDPCTVPGVTSEAQCIPSTLCPAHESPDKHSTNWFLSSRCYSDFCYLPGITSPSNCVGTCTDPLFWEPDPGLCKVVVASASACASAGGTWFNGVQWYNPLYETQEKCERGICGGGGFIWLGTDGSNCTEFGDDSYGCTARCHLCTASSGGFLCTNPNITDSCVCVNSGGTWVDELGVCMLFGVGKIGCVDSGFEVTFACNDLTFDECNSCTTPECQYLGCYAETGAACRTNLTCSTAGGECGDYYLLNNFSGSCDLVYGIDRPQSCSTGCVVPWAPTLDASGFPYCDISGFDQDIQNTFFLAYDGCFSTAVTDSATCKAGGGEIQTAGSNETSCYAGRYGCREAEFSGSFTRKNETQCDTCDGDWSPGFNWRQPNWVPYSKLPLYWVPVEAFPYYTFERIMNYTKLGDIVSIAAVERTKLSFQSEIQCLMNPLHSLLRLVACECSGLNVTTYNEVCLGSSDGIRSIQVGTTLLCSSTEDSVLMGSILLGFLQDTIPSEFGCLKAEAASIPSIQFRKPIVTSLSALSLSAASTHLVDNDYAILYNKHGRQIGQLLSDGAIIGFEYLVLNGNDVVMREVDLREVNDTIRVNNLTVCLVHNPEIQLSLSDFPVFDFAIYANRTFTPLNQAVSTQYILGQERWCSNITMGGSYFAIARVRDWEQPQQLYSSVEKGFIFTIGALFLLACFLVIVLILMTIYIHGVKGFCMNLIKGKQLASLILALLFIFSALRGIWLILAGTETINNDTSYALEAVLTDLPIYVFFSLFMLLIFFWAELYHFQFNRKQAVLGKLKIPFLLVNLFIYIFFIVIIIVYSQSTGGEQTTVGLVYKCIVAGIGFTILISFMFYGSLLVWQATRTGNGFSGNQQFMRMSIITLTCSIASLVQFIFLLLFAFLDIENVVSILVYLFVVEMIPMWLLMWMFFQPSRLQDTLTASYGSQGRNSQRLRSLPRSFRSRGESQASLNHSASSGRHSGHHSGHHSAHGSNSVDT